MFGAHGRSRIDWRCAYRLDKGGLTLRVEVRGKTRTQNVPSATVFSTFQEDPPFIKTGYKIRAQNRTYIYVRFWAYLMVFCLTIFCVPIFLPIAFANLAQMGPARAPLLLTKSSSSQVLCVRISLHKTYFKQWPPVLHQISPLLGLTKKLHNTLSLPHPFRLLTQPADAFFC